MKEEYLKINCYIKKMGQNQLYIPSPPAPFEPGRRISLSSGIEVYLAPRDEPSAIYGKLRVILVEGRYLLDAPVSFGTWHLDLACLKGLLRKTHVHSWFEKNLEIPLFSLDPSDIGPSIMPEYRGLQCGDVTVTLDARIEALCIQGNEMIQYERLIYDGY